MSTSYLSNRSRPSWSKPISSAILDVLMSSNITDDEKSSNKEKTDSVESPFKRSAIIEKSREDLTSVLQFTPSQLYKVRNTAARNNEGNSSVSSSSTSSEPKHLNSDVTNVTPTRSSSISTVNSSMTSSPTHNAELESFIDGTPNSSLFFTPMSTPTSLKTPEIVIRTRVKRTLNDQYKYEDPNSPNSSLNCSSYYTPENSPSEYGYSVKRLKTRWSGSTSSFSFNDLETLNESQRSPILVGSPDKCVIQPELIGYQMIGDSQFCRFGQQLLGLERVSMPNSPGRIGICVSGQTITDLHRRVKEKFYPISDKIILMIGTNDFLRNVDVMTMCNELTALITTLQETVKHIVLLTLPPIPKLERKQKLFHFVQLDKYNSYIRSLENGEKLRIADVSPVYMSSPPYQKCRMQLFELYFGGPARKYDMIHLNRQGLEVIRKYILEHFL